MIKPKKTSNPSAKKASKVIPAADKKLPPFIQMARRKK